MLDRRSARPVTFPVISSGLHLQIFDIIKLLWLQIKSGLSQSLSSFISVLSPSPYINQLICVTQQQVLCKEKHLELLSSTIASCVPGCLSALSERKAEQVIWSCCAHRCSCNSCVYTAADRQDLRKTHRDYCFFFTPWGT